MGGGGGYMHMVNTQHLNLDSGPQEGNINSGGTWCPKAGNRFHPTVYGKAGNKQPAAGDRQDVDPIWTGPPAYGHLYGQLY